MIFNTSFSNITVLKISVPIPTRTGGTLTYNGSVQSPTWNYDSSLVKLVSGNSGTDAGIYNTVFQLYDPSNYMWEDKGTANKSIQWEIERATISEVPSQSGTLTYNGNVQSATWDNYDSNKMTASGTTSAIEVGTYIIEFTPTANYKWADGSNDTKYVEWQILENTSNLPTGYTQLEYIQTDGHQYIDTRLKLSTDFKLIMDIQTLSAATTNNYIYHSNKYVSSGTKYGYIAKWDFKGIRAYMGSYTSASQVGSYVDNNSTPRRMIITMDIQNKITAVDNIEKIFSNNSISSEMTTLQILSIPDYYKNGYGVTAKLYSLQAYKGEELVCNFIPCISQDNIIGMYDTVTKQFFQNLGDGTFIAGPTV